MKNIKHPVVLSILVIFWSLSCVTLFPKPTPGNAETSSPEELGVITPSSIPATATPVLKVSGKIIYQTTYDTFSINPDGSNNTRLVENVRVSTLSPDGTQFAYLFRPEGSAKQEIFLMNADGSNQRPLSTNHPEYTGPSFLDWSPDGNSIVLASDSNGYDIFTTGVDGKNVLQLTHDPDPDRSPSWSSNGEKIVFISSSNVYTMNADGTERKQLTNEGNGDTPVYSPDGNWIAFLLAKQDYKYYVYVMNVDGTNQRQLSDIEASWDSLAWSPDGKWIAFKPAGNASQIICINPDGSELFELEGFFTSIVGWLP